MTQREMLDFFLPILKEEGKIYRKKTLVKAKKAVEGQVVLTHTSDGEETRNTAQSGDWLVENQTSVKENYLVNAVTFERKYSLKNSLGDGWGCYQPIGKVFAIPFSERFLHELKLNDFLEFQAPWKETMIIKPGDFLVIPTDAIEIYRIAKKEFGETYEEVKE